MVDWIGPPQAVQPDPLTAFDFVVHAKRYLDLPLISVELGGYQGLRSTIWYTEYLYGGDVVTSAWLEVTSLVRAHGGGLPAKVYPT